MQNGGLIRMPFLKIAVYRTVCILCYSLNNLQICINPRLLRTGSMEVKTNLKPPPVIIYQQRLAVVVFLPFTTGGKKPAPAHLWMNVTLLNIRGFHRVADITNYDFNQCPGLSACKAGRLARFLPACGKVICVAKTVPKGF